MADFEVDHIIPRARSGANDLSNLAFCCRGCNMRKHTAISGRDPVTGNMAPLFHPRKDRWSDHFCWSVDLVEVVGLTPVGRATISRLGLNREPLVNLRRRMVKTGEHPPSTND